MAGPERAVPRVHLAPAEDRVRAAATALPGQVKAAGRAREAPEVRPRRPPLVPQDGGGARGPHGRIGPRVTVRTSRGRTATVDRVAWALGAVPGRARASGKAAPGPQGGVAAPQSVATGRATAYRRLHGEGAGPRRAAPGPHGRAGVAPVLPEARRAITAALAAVVGAVVVA